MADDLDRAFRDMVRETMRTHPLLIRIGQALAPSVNRVAPQICSYNKPQPDKYCPGCGERSSWAPDLCPECLEYDATQGSAKT